ncbi:MAG: hypothetical protein HY001_00170 [Candidatus Portnoybacteria bacterium]|nr:hypothetical protein [Candidatus Portnoybacteria bacterium]
MIDRSRSGRRCRTLWQVDNLPRGSYGTIRYEMDNLERDLVFVNWDNGMEALVFPHEIEVLEKLETEVLDDAIERR